MPHPEILGGTHEAPVTPQNCAILSSIFPMAEDYDGFEFFWKDLDLDLARF